MQKRRSNRTFHRRLNTSILEIEYKISSSKIEMNPTRPHEVANKCCRVFRCSNVEQHQQILSLLAVRQTFSCSAHTAIMQIRFIRCSDCLHQTEGTIVRLYFEIQRRRNCDVGRNVLVLFTALIFLRDSPFFNFIRGAIEQA